MDTRGLKKLYLFGLLVLVTLVMANLGSVCPCDCRRIASSGDGVAVTPSPTAAGKLVVALKTEGGEDGKDDKGHGDGHKPPPDPKKPNGDNGKPPSGKGPKEEDSTSPTAAPKLPIALKTEGGQDGKGDKGRGGGRKPPPDPKKPNGPNGKPPSGKGPTEKDSTGKETPRGLGPGDWEWADNPNNRRGGKWVDKGKKTEEGSFRSASWDEKPVGKAGKGGIRKPGKPHWDEKDGRGNSTKVDENGIPVSHEEAHPPPGK